MKLVDLMVTPTTLCSLKNSMSLRFSMALNYIDNVEIVNDVEPRMKSLLASVQVMRQHLGYPTTVPIQDLVTKVALHKLRGRCRPFENRAILWFIWQVSVAIAC